MRFERAIAAIRAVMLALAGWVALAGVALGMDTRDRSIDQFYHTAWTVREGAPGQVTALVQTADGFLWLGTQTGLYRFDGVRFERYRPRTGGDFPASSVASLYAPPDGGLWVGFRYGFASYIDGDKATHYGASSGLPTATIYAMAGTPDGRVWGATFNGLVALRDNRWHVVGPAMGLPGIRARNLTVDREGRLWVASDVALAWLPPGGDRFVVATRDVGKINRISEAPDGSVWVADVDRGVLPLWHDTGDPAAVGPSLRVSSSGMLFDRDGALWVAAMGDGLRRVPRVHDLARQAIEAEGSAAQRFVERDGLTSDYISAIIQDREGNIWVGGSRGLDRFRASRLLPAPTPSGATDFAIAPAASRGIWIGTKNRPLMRVDALGASTVDFPQAITAAARDDRTTWLAGPGGVWTMEGDAPALFASLPVEDFTGVQAITGDGHGGVWVSINRPGVYHYSQGDWHRELLPAVANDPSPLVLVRDRTNRLWMGFARDTIIVRDEAGHDTVIGARDGLEVGNVTALLPDNDVTWVGGERGINIIDGGHVHVLALQMDLRGISGIVRDQQGDYWANASQGIVRIRGSDVAHARRDAGFSVPVTLFDSLDGLPGTPAQFRPLPTAVASDNGRLWFATTSGVVSIDPADVPRNTLPPPVTIRGIATDMGWFETAGRVELPAKSARLRIEYTATSLSMPERVRFRYRMDGIDKHWRDAGTDREAVYTDPPPGHYVFRVTAANEDGVWNEQGASIGIDVAPAFYQTAWFAAILAIIGAAVVWALVLMRVRRVETQLRERLHERHAERERIARELHDTLLQSIQGLMMRFQAVANRVPHGEPLRASMESALDRAELALVEARDRVRDLRDHLGDTVALDMGLVELARAYADEHAVPVTVDAPPVWHGMDPLARDELYGIAREAVHNAVAHAHASRIDVSLHREGAEVVLGVYDDGQGIGPGILAAGRPGHWGLRGIHERAENIGGKASITSSLGGGTHVVVRVPISRVMPLPAWWRRWIPGA
ncbi:MAG TPA: two-component regulator propeller domain-containing protein [Luteibacter sp.]|jgi:signal transduction histidine kinase/ligand-binding sensor domain-containing protein|uniref:sensor histidine kinase n=1 Tax=Luteibacter sp. TaxID=1886636 RepID=UPI002F41E866